MDAVKNKNITIIGVPLHYGADRKGVDLGPDAIRGANLHERLQALGYSLEDLGDLNVRRSLQPPAPGEKLKYLGEIARVNQDLCETVSAEMGKGRFPLVLGGDHSIAIGTIKGVLQRVKRLGVIWFDAHSDVNTHLTTGSGNIHGMSLAAALGYGHPDLISIGGAGLKLQPENVVIIGARSIDPGEREFLKAKGIKVFTMHDIDRYGMKQVMEDAMDIVSNGTDGVHLSLDLDGMDPWDAPGVGTPVSGGMSYRESHFAMELLFERNLLVSAEFVEVNPMLDRHNKTAVAAVELIGSAFGERIL
ncbi:arginase [Paenibacillus sacheonensis]|uniref:Arginase n=1 Tax=Paenibacillus sacheonensis TaxID=742054 RepID=A0A7X4YKS4_9BACL|nr:arginase [Paenibacillus sacheonensis]MBM7563240.1 arginase [Paenibacillus sacheonensis]NBC68201.1 arginase [Paenibacillus sacheonensis]